MNNPFPKQSHFSTKPERVTEIAEGIYSIEIIGFRWTENENGKYAQAEDSAFGRTSITATYT